MIPNLNIIEVAGNEIGESGGAEKSVFFPQPWRVLEVRILSF